MIRDYLKRIFNRKKFLTDSTGEPILPPAIKRIEGREGIYLVETQTPEDTFVVAEYAWGNILKEDQILLLEQEI